MSGIAIGEYPTLKGGNYLGSFTEGNFSKKYKPGEDIQGENYHSGSTVQLENSSH